jgi:iron complex transport system substrate-binding protein
MTGPLQTRLTRRSLGGVVGGAAAALALTGTGLALQATPGASPLTGEWSHTDVLGKTVTLPERPVRIVANLVTAAALWDLGIEAVAVFDWTASAYPDGDHIAWGNVPADQVANIGDTDGNIKPEDLILAEPDIILTLTFDPTDPSQTGGIVPDLAARIEQIAPVLVVTDMGSTGVQLKRLVDLVASLGADLEAPETVAARTAFEEKVAEFQATASEQATVTSLFANFSADALYIGGPNGVAELQYMQDLGLTFANADSAAAGDFWETLSLEEAIKYPSDVVFSDVYSSFLTLEDLQRQPTLAVMPAVEGGQVGLWKRDFPVSYAGVTDFLETILVTLRDAQKVTE